MDKEALQRQLEDLEEASEKWRAERRRMNAEIDKLETALADAKADATRKRESAEKAQRPILARWPECRKPPSKNCARPVKSGTANEPK
jgi:septal ring factor EnvC (AmiA/AmiB activator)